LASAAVAILPVLLFLAALVLMDSFKLVPLRTVAAALAAGGLAALAAEQVNATLADAMNLHALEVARNVAPVVEEILKALFVAYLVRRGRVGFLVDAAILGFAVGAGFSLVENLEYLRALSDRGLLLWVVRGFGTAVLHGGTTATLAIATKSLYDRFSGRPLAQLDFVPGLLLAILLHLFFNRAILPPVATTLLLLAGLPCVMVLVFARSERATRSWLGVGLDSDLEVLESILKGAVLDTRVGRYLESLKSRFAGPVVADMLCLLRIQLELSIRAKGLLLAREVGLEPEVGEDVRANLQELRYLERSIGRTGLLALHPILRRTSRDLWQVYMLKSGLFVRSK
jgi:RsiW-degrading membrane proteinase PrsW (M82 family)